MKFNWNKQTKKRMLTVTFAVFAVSILLVSAVLIMNSNPVHGDVTHEHYVRYYAEGATRVGDNPATPYYGYVAVGYDGIISTEYNPEKWDESSANQSTPKNISSVNWVGPSYTASAILMLPAVTTADTYSITLPNKYKIEDQGWSGTPGITTTVWSKSLSVSDPFNVTLTFSDNKVFGGWVTADGTEPCTITRTIDGSSNVIWTYTDDSTIPSKAYYRETCSPGGVWTYEESTDGSSWTVCQKHNDRYYLRYTSEGKDHYCFTTEPLYSYTEKNSVWTWNYKDQFMDADTWGTITSDKTAEKLTDKFGNVWADVNTITSYKVYRGEKEYLPGDVIPNTIGSLRVKWIESDHFTKVFTTWTDNSIDYSDLDASKLTLSQTQNGIDGRINIQDKSFVKTDGVTKITLGTDKSGNTFTYRVTFGKDNDSGSIREKPSLYGTIYELPYGNGRTDETNNQGRYYISGSLPTGTYRSSSNDKPRLYPGTDGGTSAITLSGDALFDTVNFGSNLSNSSVHGSSNAGINANGKVLIIGTGVEMRDRTGGVCNYFQVFGGGGSKITDYREKEMVFASGEMYTAKASTCVIIHSGVYFNVAAGGHNGQIGDTNMPRSTYLVMKGGAVLDSLYGGCGGTGKMYSGESTDLNKEGSYVYMTGAFMSGDNWVDTQTGDYTGQRATYDVSKINKGNPDVSVLIGANNKGTFQGSSHVFITDHASVYDVAGAGRECSGSTFATTDCSYVEISGRSTVRHAVAGGIMNGITVSKQMVSHTHVVIAGNCRIASVYGAGYDIWSESTGNSMMDGGTVDIEMSGGTVGNIFGGGYRGTVGNTAKYDALKITIDITGGTVLESVYGGGSGGLEKGKHKADGTVTNTGDGGFKDSTGRSDVYATIDVNISGGTINGNVYGGGKSLPALSYYSSGTTYSTFINDSRNVAQVFGTIDVSITNGTINGNVYGGGRGVEWTYNNNVFTIDSVPTLSLIKTSGDAADCLVNAPWYKKDNTAVTYTYNTDYDHIRYDSGSYYGYYLDYAKVSGNVSVTVTGGTIGHSVYGGGANGRVVEYTGQKDLTGSTTVTIKGGKITENVFGGGLGIQNVIATTGNRSVYVDYGSVSLAVPGNNIIDGSVYGGSRNGDDGISGKTDSITTVVIGQALIGNPNTGDGSSVYGGGFMGKTYGNTRVYVGYYYEEGSNTPTINNRGEGKNVVFLNSIYAGGDITTEGGTVANPFTEDLVMGTGSVYIYGDGANGLMYIKGSVMGSGNSCNTKGFKTITIESLNHIDRVLNGQDVRMTGIHRADVLNIIQSNLDITSRSTLSEVIGSLSGKDLSVFDIHDMYLRNNSTIVVRAPMDKIVNYYSYSKDNKPTTVTSPSNRLVNATGTTFYVREMVKDETTGHFTGVEYGNVFGYTLLESMTGQSYGAYVIADRYSTGGFVVAKSGTYREADSSIMGDNDVKCWFLSGTQTKVVTMNLDYKGGNQSIAGASLDIVKMQSGTSMRYTGSTFTSVSTDKDGNEFKFIRPGTEQYGYEFGMVIGYGATSTTDSKQMQADTRRYLQLVDNGDGTYSNGWFSGTYYSEDPNEANGSYEPMVGEETNPLKTLTKLSPVTMKMGSDAGTYSINLLFTGRPENTTMYVGYMTISLQEIENVEYESMDSSGNIIKQVNTMVTNNVNIRVDMYVIGSGSIEDESTYKVILKGDEVEDGVLSGYAEIIIPKGYISGNLVLTGVSTNQYVMNGQSITVSAVINQDNTTGWMTVNNAVKWTKGASNESNVPIGTMSGTVVATIRYSVENFVHGSLEDGHNPQFVLHLQTTISTSPTPIPSDITVVIDKKPMRTVTYHDDFNHTSGSVQYPDGTYITADSWKSMGSNFIGWYLDDDFTNAYDYNMPVTKDMDLYARFSFVVTFDYMNGNSSKMYVVADKEGSLLNANKVPHPTYYGYDLMGWYKDKTCIVEWDYAFDSVTGDTTLYAKWKGTEVKVNFYYWDEKASGTDKWVELESASDMTTTDIKKTIVEKTISEVVHYYDMLGNEYTKDGDDYTIISDEAHDPKKTMDPEEAKKSIYEKKLDPNSRYFDIFGNEYTKDGDSYIIKTVVGYTYYEDTNTGFLYILKGSRTGTTANDVYEACNYGGYVIRWLDNAPYFPTVRYGSNFNTIDSIQSSPENPINILDYAQECVQPLIGDDKFVRWQAYSGGEYNSGTTVGVYSDTVLSSNMVNLSKKGQNGMPEINLYALTAKVAIYLTMNKNTEDASAIVSAPDKFLVYPTPTVIERAKTTGNADNYFDNPPPYHLDNEVEYEKVGDSVKYPKYVDDNGANYYKIRNYDITLVVKVQRSGGDADTVCSITGDNRYTIEGYDSSLSTVSNISVSVNKHTISFKCSDTTERYVAIKIKASSSNTAYSIQTTNDSNCNIRGFDENRSSEEIRESLSYDSDAGTISFNPAIYISSDGLKQYRLNTDGTYYYVQDDDKVFVLDSIDEESATASYRDIYGNIWKVNPSGSKWIWSESIDLKHYTINGTSTNYDPDNMHSGDRVSLYYDGAKVANARMTGDVINYYADPTVIVEVRVDSGKTCTISMPTLPQSQSDCTLIAVSELTGSAFYDIIISEDNKSVSFKSYDTDYHILAMTICVPDVGDYTINKPTQGSFRLNDDVKQIDAQVIGAVIDSQNVKYTIAEIPYYRETKLVAIDKDENTAHTWMHEAKVSLYQGVVYIDFVDGVKYHIDVETKKFTILDEHTKQWVDCGTVGHYHYKEDDRYTSQSIITDRADVGLTKEAYDSTVIVDGSRRNVKFYTDEGITITPANGEAITLTMSGETANNTIRAPDLWGNIKGYGYFSMNLAGLNKSGKNIWVYQENTALSLASSSDTSVSSVSGEKITKRIRAWSFSTFEEDNYGHDLGILIPQDGSQIVVKIYAIDSDVGYTGVFATDATILGKHSESLVVSYTIETTNLKTVVDLDKLTVDHNITSKFNSDYKDWSYVHSTKTISGELGNLTNVSFVFKNTEGSSHGISLSGITNNGTAITVDAEHYDAAAKKHGLDTANGTYHYSSSIADSGRKEKGLEECYKIDAKADNDQLVRYYTDSGITLVENGSISSKEQKLTMSGTTANNTVLDSGTGTCWGNITGYGFFTINLSALSSEFETNTNVWIYQKNTALSLASSSESEYTHAMSGVDKLYSERIKSWSFAGTFNADTYDKDLAILIPQDGTTITIEIYAGSTAASGTFNQRLTALNTMKTNGDLIVRYVIDTSGVNTIVDLEDLADPEGKGRSYPISQYEIINKEYKDWAFNKTTKRISGTPGSNVVFFGKDIKIVDEISSTEIISHGLEKSHVGHFYQKIAETTYLDANWTAQEIIYDPVSGSSNLYTDQFNNIWEKLTDDIYKLKECDYVWKNGSNDRFKAVRSADGTSVTWIYSKYLKDTGGWTACYKEKYDRRQDMWFCYESSDNGSNWTSCDMDTRYYLVTRNTVWKDVVEVSETVSKQYTATRTIEEVTNNIKWTYLDDKGREAYLEVYNIGTGSWSYQVKDGESWSAATEGRVPGFYLKPTDSQDRYTKFDDICFGKHEWLVIPVVVNTDECVGDGLYLDQFGNIWKSNGDETYTQKTSRVVQFEKEYTFMWDSVQNGHVDYELYDAFGTKYPAYLEINTSSPPAPSEMAGSIRTTCKIPVDYNTPVCTNLLELKKWNGSAWSEGPIYKEFFWEFKKSNDDTNDDKYTVYVFQRQIGSGGWTTVYIDCKDPLGDHKYYTYSNGMEEGSPMSIFYYVDAYTNKYVSHDNKEYYCVEGSTTYYEFNYRMNEATRNGYKLTGWHNTHVNIDDALYPSSGLTRNMRIFFGVNPTDGDEVISKEILHATDASGNVTNILTGDYDNLEVMSDSTFSYCSYNGKALPRLDDVNKMYSIEYSAIWEPMTYTISVSEASYGTVSAYLVKDGNRTQITGTREVNYGDRIELLYSDMGKYSFTKWVATGECDVADEYSNMTTLVVHGNCSVTATAISERIVTLAVRFDAGKLSEDDRENHVQVYLRNTLDPSKEYQLTYYDLTTLYESYIGYVPLSISDVNEGYTVVVKYVNSANDIEEYELTGFIKVDVDNDLNFTYDIISARIVESITTKSHPDLENSHVYYSGVDKIVWDDNQRTELGIRMLNKIVVNEGTEDDPIYKEVVRVTRYVGVDSSYLERDDINTIINNPENGIEPVILTINAGYQYTVLEGFLDEEGGSHYDINFNHNYHIGYSDEVRTEYFNLNWTRTDKPADIIVIITKVNEAPSVRLTYNATTPLDTHSYTKAKDLVRGDSIWAEAGSITESNLEFSETEKTNYDIEGWYLDEAFTQPVTPSLVMDNDFVTKILKIEDGVYKYYLYAKVVNAADKKTINVAVNEDIVGGYKIGFKCANTTNTYTVVLNVTVNIANVPYTLIADPGYTISSVAIDSGTISENNRVITFTCPNTGSYTITVTVKANAASTQYTLTASTGFTVNSISGTASDLKGELAFQFPDTEEYAVALKLKETATGTHTLSSPEFGYKITGIGVGSDVTNLTYHGGVVTFQCSDTNAHNIVIKVKVTKANTDYTFTAGGGFAIGNVTITGNGTPVISKVGNVITFRCPETDSTYTITVPVTASAESTSYTLTTVSGCTIDSVSKGDESVSSLSHVNGSVSFTCPNGTNDYNVVVNVRVDTPGEYYTISKGSENYNITGIGSAILPLNLVDESYLEAGEMGLNKNMVYFNTKNTGEGSFVVKLKAYTVGKYNIRPTDDYTIESITGSSQVVFSNNTIEFKDMIEHTVTITIYSKVTKNGCLFMAGTGYTTTGVGGCGGVVTSVNNNNYASWGKMSGRDEVGLTGEEFVSSINGGTRTVKFHSDDSAVFTQNYYDYNNVKLTLSGTTANNTRLDPTVNWGDINGYGFFTMNFSGLNLSEADAAKNIWVYQKNTALSIAEANEYGTQAFNDGYSERIRFWSYNSVLRIDDYAHDLGILIPQDGSEIIIEIYISSSSLDPGYTYEQAKGALDTIRGTSGTLLVRYTIDTSSIKTVVDLDAMSHNSPMSSYTKINGSYKDWAFDYSSKTLSGELLPNVTFLSSAGVKLGVITENGSPVTGDNLTTFVAEHGLDTLTKGMVIFESSETGSKTLKVKIRASAPGTYKIKATGSGYTMTAVSAEGIPPGDITQDPVGTFNVKIPDTNVRVFTITINVSFTSRLYLIPAEAGYSITGIGDGSTVTILQASYIYLSQRYDKELTADAHVSNVQVDGRDGNIKFYANDGVKISTTSVDGKDVNLKMEGTTPNNTRLDSTNWSVIKGYGFFDLNFSGLNLSEEDAAKNIWVYQKNTALSLAAEGDYGTAPVTNSPYTERIRNWSFSNFREDYYGGDLGILIPQDGSDVIIEIYVSHRSLSPSSYTYEAAKAILDQIRAESNSLIVRYTIDTSGIKTIVDLDQLTTGYDLTPINSNYKDWSFNYGTKKLSGVPGINIIFHGKDIVLDKKAYSGTFVVDGKTGFTVRDITPGDINITGTEVEYRVTMNKENGVLKSVSVVVFNAPTSGRIDLYLDRNAVTLNINKEMLDTYGEKHDIPWTNDKYTAKYGEVVKLPTMTRDGVSMISGKAWTSSPLVTITDTNTYTVSVTDTGTINLTPHFIQENLVKVTFNTSAGTYDNGQHIYVVEIQKNKGTPSFDPSELLSSWNTVGGGVLVPQDATGYTFSGYVDSSGNSKLPKDIKNIENDIQLTAVMTPSFHNFTFNKDVADRMEISATNDSSSSMLVVGSNNAALEHHSEISFIVKPTSGRTISINEINDWAYMRVEGEDVITTNPIASYFDLFGNKYSETSGGSLVYSIVWAYEGTENMLHTQGYYTQYLIDHSTSKTYKNMGEGILAANPALTDWKEYDMDSVRSYYYIKTSGLTGSGSDGILLLSVHKDYVKVGTDYKEMAWTKFTGLGEPEKLSDDRGYMYTFFLDQDIDLTAHTTVQSVNINFVVNGVPVTSGDMAAWGLIGDDRGNAYLYGNNVPMYEKVMFCSFDTTVSYSKETGSFSVEGAGVLRWYTDRACTKPLAETTHVGEYHYYELTAVEDMTLYTTQNVVITKMYDKNGDMIRGFQLLRDSNNYNKITLPGIKAPLYGHLFIGWGTLSNGINTFSYAPSSTFDPGTGINELNLYAYYLDGGADQVIPYDGNPHVMDIIPCAEKGTYEGETYVQSEAINTVQELTYDGINKKVTFKCPDKESDYIVVVKVRASAHPEDIRTISTTSNCNIVGIGSGSTATDVEYSNGKITFKCTADGGKYDTVVIKVRATSLETCTIGPVTTEHPTESSYCDIIDVTNAKMTVRISDDPNKVMGDDALPVLILTDFIDKTYYYYVKVTSEGGSISETTGSFTFAINKVELFVIAPSAVFVEGDGKNHFVTSSQIQIIAATGGGYVPNPSDIAGYVLDTEMPGYSDYIDHVGSVRTAASIYFVEGKADNYIIHYIDGSLIMYPKESARYMVGGY